LLVVVRECREPIEPARGSVRGDDPGVVPEPPAEIAFERLENSRVGRDEEDDRSRRCSGQRGPLMELARPFVLMERRVYDRSC